MAALLCRCEDGRAWREAQSARQKVQAMFCDQRAEAVELLLAVVEATRKGLLESGSSIKLSETVTAKVKTAGGSVQIKRSQKTENQASI